MNNFGNPFKPHVEATEPVNDNGNGELKNYVDVVTEEQAINHYNTAEMEYKTAKEKLAYHKDVLFKKFGERVTVGTNNFDVANFELKIVQRENISVEVEDVNTLNQVLQQIAIHSDGGVEVAQQLFRWNPELNKVVYDNLTPELQSLLQPFLVTKLASPTIKIGTK